jgi:DNA-binding FrmR family transcriptional regulator
MSDLHQPHPEISNRLKRAEGHLRRIIAMIEEQRSCLDLAQQLHAVEKAIWQGQEKAHPCPHRPCLERSIHGGSASASGRASIEEFRAITKYL